jgi:hypothetical protein
MRGNGAEVIWTAPGVRVCIAPGDGLEFENPLTGSETALGYPVQEWLDADYAAGEPAWYDDWTVNSPDIEGNDDQIWMRTEGHEIYTASTVSSSVVSVHLVGDADDGLADIYVDGSLVTQLDMGTPDGVDRACCLVTGLSHTPHTIEVHAVGPGVTGLDDVATMGAAVLSGPKWTQGPDLEPTGMDVLNTYWPLESQGYVLADDFPCTSPGALTAIRFWGSWYDDQLPFGNDPTGVSFTLSIHEDIPDPDGEGPLYSMPGALLWQHIYGPGECAFELYRDQLDEGWLEPPDVYEPSADTQCWLYECPGPDPVEFTQQGTPTAPLVYWLDLQAVPEDPTAQFGWKTSTDRWNDGAVWAPGVYDAGPMSWGALTYPQGHPQVPQTLDLAFEIWGDEAPPTNGTVCEPQGPAAHPTEYWYRATQTAAWCAFHVRVYDHDPANYSNWNVPPGWVFGIHKAAGEWWASWWDPEDGCPNAISGTFTFQFTNPNPSKWGLWVMNSGNDPDPGVLIIDGSCNHPDEPNGYGHMVHVPAVCAVADPPTQSPTEAGYPTSRYLSFVPSYGDERIAFRVTAADLPQPFAHLNGCAMWIGPPEEYCENAGQAEPPPGGCGSAPGLPLRFALAKREAEPYFADWSGYDVVRVAHPVIIPGGTYHIQGIYESCDTDLETDYSVPAAVETSHWGDAVGNCTVIPCLPPDGVVNVTTDVTAVLDKFKNLSGAVAKARADFEPEVPDQRVNITDVTFCLDAFLGAAYPFPGPGECP